MDKKNFFTEPFLQNKKLHVGILGLFVAINALAGANAILHHPEIGYDANDHLLYMQVLPERLPVDGDTREFFSPPLPYFFSSLVNRACLALNNETTEIVDCRYWGGKSGQIINIFLSIGTTFLVLKIAHLWQPDNAKFKIITLVMLGSLPVYYKTFSQFWGQPYVAFFSVLSTWLLYRLLRDRKTNIWKSGILLGCSLGLLILSRQWGFFVLAVIAGFAGLNLLVEGRKPFAVQVLKKVIVSMGVAFLVGGWFYLYLLGTEGSTLAFNRNSTGFAFSNKEPSFYRNTGLKDFELFRSPVYGTFNDMFIPIFYSDIWGDYWGFYTLPNLTTHVLSIWDWTEQDYYEARAYLGRVNLVSLPIAAFLAISVLAGLRKTLSWLMSKPENGLAVKYSAFVFLLTAITALGYLWFVISYPTVSGDTIKATYIIHLFILLPLLIAQEATSVGRWKNQVFFVTIAVCGLVVLHNFPAMITRYVFIP